MSSLSKLFQNRLSPKTVTTVAIMATSLEDDPFGDDPLFGKAPFSVTVCLRCVSGKTSTAVPVDPFPEELTKVKAWCLKVRCPRCDFNWYVCRECRKIRQIMDTEERL